jgi:peroxiredoxin
MLESGDPAPDFYLPAADDPESEYMLSSAATQAPVVLGFVPAAETPARALLSALAGVDWASVTDGVAVFGLCRSEQLARKVSADLPFPVLHDRDGYVAGQYDLPTDRTPQAVAVVDGRCTIRFSWARESDADRPPLSAITETVAGL